MIEQNKSKELPHILLGKHSFEIDLYDLAHIIIEGSEYSKRRVYLDSLIRQFLKKYTSNVNQFVSDENQSCQIKHRNKAITAHHNKIITAHR